MDKPLKCPCKLLDLDLCDGINCEIEKELNRESEELLGE